MDEAMPTSSTSAGGLRQRGAAGRSDSASETSLATDAKHQGTKDEHAPDKRMASFKTRSVSTFTMIFGFIGLIYAGPLALTLLIMTIQIIMFHEILTLGFNEAKNKNIPLFRSIQFLFLITTLYYLYGLQALRMVEDTIIDTWLWTVHEYHTFISFFLYTIDLVLFVMSLRKDLYQYQFGIFALTHMTLLLVPIQASFIISNLSQGLFWFIGPASVVVANDCWAYMVGFFYGKTPLIELSPKKTWEGYIGGGIATIIFAFVAAGWVAQFDWIVCPQPDILNPVASCVHPEVFVYRLYYIPDEVVLLLQKIGVGITAVWIRPIQLHAVVFAIFASSIGPFGGFFASGFKRAFKIKDFGDTIPGHGGLTDRMDCQLLMGMFCYVYFNSFVRPKAPQLMPTYSRILHMAPMDQVDLYHRLRDSLAARKLIGL